MKPGNLHIKAVCKVLNPAVLTENKVLKAPAVSLRALFGVFCAVQKEK